jgi:transglutaminase-like putative cysteine protease
MRTSPLLVLPRPQLFDLLPAIVLSALIVAATTWTLAVSPWAPDLQVLTLIAAVAFPSGLLLAATRGLPAAVLHGLSALLGISWTVLQLAPRMDSRLSGWADYAADVLLRLLNLLRTLTAGGRGEDLLLFVAALALLVWISAYASAWELVRHGRSWPTLLFNLPTLLLNYTYVSPKPDTAALIVLVATLLLWVHHAALQRQQLWQGLRVDYPDFVPFRALLAAGLLVAVLIPLSSALPRAVTIGRTELWELLAAPVRAARAGWEDIFSTIIAAPGGGSGSFTTRSAALGGARQLGDAAVLTVRTARYDYWRGVVFDTYEAGSWRNTTGELARAARGAAAAEQARTRLPADTELAPLDRLGRRAVQLQMTPLRDRNDDLLLAAGNPLSFSRDVAVEHLVESAADGTTVDRVDDTALIAAQSAVRADEMYTVTALLSFADVPGLRSAGEEYPQWVRARYLQLPADFPATIRVEAARVIAAAGADNPYDAAIALQDYLRTLTYNESIPTPPAGLDPVEWFLFDQREGYCDYFASAMVLMLRSAGIPARWARGYAGGDYDAERGIYVVTERVAHSWPEVYFPGYGWERFEPTAADYTVLPDRPLERAPTDDLAPALVPPLQNLPDREDADPARFEPLDEGLVGEREIIPAAPQAAAAGPTWWAAPLLAVVLVVGGLSAVRAFVLRGLRGARRRFADLAWLAAAAGFPQQPAETAVEYSSRLARVWPEHRAELSDLAAVYVRERYSQDAAAAGPPPVLRAVYLSLLRAVVFRRSAVERTLSR